jgi:hypothetical protein
MTHGPFQTIALTLLSSLSHIRRGKEKKGFEGILFPFS